MTGLLPRVFIRDHEKTSDPKVRAAYGTLSGIVGIVVNLLLFAGKFIAGTVSGSIAITADAFNNLSDAGSSIVSLVSFRIAAKPADRDHPFGHARIEYIASMIVSFLVLLVGFEVASDSVKKIVSRESTLVFSILAVTVLSVSILAKLWLALFNFRLGKKIGSDVMRATAVDSLSDTLSTAAVLAATLIFRFTGIDVDAWVGIAVALFIFWAGVRILRETQNSLLGEAPVKEVTDAIDAIVSGYPAILGIHDMMIHSYGPGHSFASFHAEVDGADDVFESHDVIDEVERRIRDELSIVCTIHMDPINTDDELTTELREETEELVREIDPRITVHDFRVVTGVTHTNLIFDVAVPFEIKMTVPEIKDAVSEKIRARHENYYAVVTVDRN
ncbi:MAG: cation transporter [Clostridia bacterium]|nr:cation transporter [Clostridia bacterium]